MQRLLDGKQHILQQHHRRAHIHAPERILRAERQKAQLLQRRAQRTVIRLAAADGVGMVALQTAREQLVQQHPAALGIGRFARAVHRADEQQPPGRAAAHLIGGLQRPQRVIELPHLHRVPRAPARKRAPLGERDS